MVVFNEKSAYALRGVNTWRLNAILEFAGDSILDVGCGNGAYVLKLSDQYRIFGVDLNQFDTWASMPHLFSICPATKLGFNDGSFDTVVSFETVEHLEEPEMALREYHRVCRKNIIITVPNCQITSGMKQSNLLYSHWVDRTHRQFFDLDSIRQLVQQAGFTIRKSGYINRITLLPFLIEAFDVKGSLGRMAARILSRFLRWEYYITCLIVADKEAA